MRRRTGFARGARAWSSTTRSQRGRERDRRCFAVGHDRRFDGDAQRCGRRIERHGRPECLAGHCQERRRGRSNPEREVKPDPRRRLAEEERPGRHDVAAVVDPLPDDEPPVFDSVRRIELVLLHVPADERADVGPQVLGQLVRPAVRLGKQVQASGTFEQQVRPGVAGVRCRSQPAHRPTKSARLRIHESGAHCVPEAVALAARAVEATPHQVAQPSVELVDARRRPSVLAMRHVWHAPRGRSRLRVPTGWPLRPLDWRGCPARTAPSQVDWRLVPRRRRRRTGGRARACRGSCATGRSTCRPGRRCPPPPDTASNRCPDRGPTRPRRTARPRSTAGGRRALPRRGRRRHRAPASEPVRPSVSATHPLQGNGCDLG